MPELNESNPIEAQRWLIRNGYLAKGEDDNKIGPKTRQAYQRALNDQRNNSGIRKISLNEAQKQYADTNSTGFGSVAGRYLYHVLMPEKVFGRELIMKPNKGLKQQAAAIIGHEGDTGSILNHKNYLKSDSDNPNKQQSGNIGLSKSWGAFEWFPDENGNIVIDDDYNFHMIHTPTLSSDGKPVYNSEGNMVYTSVEGIPEKTGNWEAIKGLFKDLKGGYWNALFKGSNKEEILQTLAENFGTRQGKTRDSNFTLSVDDINRWNN